jgi:tRNA (adenine22-N1)-methyltransferase
MKPSLSKRMMCLANMVTPGKRIADIGCDHALVSIYLVSEGISPKVLAMDIGEGPLEAAKANIEKYGLSESIETRLSDGMSELKPGETDGAVIAGMGGLTIVGILERSLHNIKPGYELVLSPQSDIPLVRRYLREHGFRIIDEDMLSEDGKYYCVIKARLEDTVYFDVDNGRAGSACMKEEKMARTTAEDKLLQIYDMYGEKLIEKKNPVLKEYLEKQMEKYQGIFCRISKSSGEGAAERMLQIRSELALMEEVINNWG